MLTIWSLITIATILFIVLGHKLHMQGFVTIGSVMMLVGCLQIIAEFAALL